MVKLFGGGGAKKVDEEPPQEDAGKARGDYDVDDHLLSREDVAERYGVQIDWTNVGASQGLTSGEAEARLKANGPNRLTPPKETPEIVKFLKQFANPLMALLLVAGALTYMAYALQQPRDKNNLILASALIIVVTLTCLMSYWQERSAGNVMASLKKMIPNKCTVIRDGHEQKVEATELVVGDLVRLYIGDRIPADIRIVENFDLKVECSSLTGESDLVPASVDKKHDIPAEARNLVFMSTLAMNGEARGVVIKTGDHTMIGKIATLATDTHTHRSSLQVEVHRLVWFVGILAFVVAIILFVIGLARNEISPLNAFVNGFILVVVANVPEGLPATVTSLLSLTALRLRDRNVLIKRTDIIENLGNATIIASDKTGTLTQNRMTVENLWCNQELQKGNQYQPVVAPGASLARASNLARISLARRSTLALSKMSRTLELTRMSRSLERMSKPLGRVSHMDHAAQMAIGRVSRMKGDGTFELSTAPNAKLGRMSVMSADGNLPTFTVQTFQELSSISWDGSSTLMKLVTVATVCNKAKFAVAEEPAGGEKEHSSITVPTFQGSADDRKILGDATDSGLLRYCDKLAPSSVVRMAYKKIFDIPFNSANKWALAVTESPGDKRHQLVFMKGAPEIVLTKCSHHFHNREEKPIDDAFRATMQEAYERCGFMGERVIGFAYKKIPARPTASYQSEEGAPPTDGLVFMGLISLVDPPREGVLEAVNKCRNAGIRVAMVTGDHPLTAEAIARKVGIVTLQTAREVAAEEGLTEEQVLISDERVGAAVITGAQIRKIQTAEEWDDILTKPEIVFARTSPQQKLQIVENLQRLGEVVAVTGDGVNDSPALKRAQIGVAMGLGGSDVAREAADIVLMDDEFPSIVNAIEEGRVIYDNLKKTIAYTLTHAVPEVWPLFLNLVLNFPLGLGGLLILSIDLITEQGPAISLAYEPAEAQVMERPPRDINRDRLINGPILRYAYLIAGGMSAVICMLSYFTMFWWYHIPLSLVYNSASDFWSPNSGDLKFDCNMVNGAEVCRVLTGQQQAEIFYQAQSAWYVTLIMGQFWHIWTCKTRTESIFKHGIFRNPVTLYGVTISLAVMLVVVYAPFLQGIFTTWTLPGIGWVPQIGYAVFIFGYTEYSKKLCRADPEGWWATHMAW